MQKEKKKLTDLPNDILGKTFGFLPLNEGLQQLRGLANKQIVLDDRKAKFTVQNARKGIYNLLQDATFAQISSINFKSTVAALKQPGISSSICHVRVGDVPPFQFVDFLPTLLKLSNLQRLELMEFSKDHTPFPLPPSLTSLFVSSSSPAHPELLESFFRAGAEGAEANAEAKGPILKSLNVQIPKGILHSDLFVSLKFLARLETIRLCINWNFVVDEQQVTKERVPVLVHLADNCPRLRSIALHDTDLSMTECVIEEPEITAIFQKCFQLQHLVLTTPELPISTPHIFNDVWQWQLQAVPASPAGSTQSGAFPHGAERHAGQLERWKFKRIRDQHGRLAVVIHAEEKDARLGTSEQRLERLLNAIVWTGKQHWDEIRFTTRLVQPIVDRLVVASVRQLHVVWTSLPAEYDLIDLTTLERLVASNGLEQFHVRHFEALEKKHLHDVSYQIGSGVIDFKQLAIQGYPIQNWEDNVQLLNQLTSFVVGRSVPFSRKAYFKLAPSKLKHLQIHFEPLKTTQNDNAIVRDLEKHAKTLEHLQLSNVLCSCELLPQFGHFERLNVLQLKWMDGPLLDAHLKHLKNLASLSLHQTFRNNRLLNREHCFSSESFKRLCHANPNLTNLELAMWSLSKGDTLDIQPLQTLSKLRTCVLKLDVKFVNVSQVLPLQVDHLELGFFFSSSSSSVASSSPKLLSPVLGFNSKQLQNWNISMDLVDDRKISKTLTKPTATRPNVRLEPNHFETISKDVETNSKFQKKWLEQQEHAQSFETARTNSKEIQQLLAMGMPINHPLFEYNGLQTFRLKRFELTRSSRLVGLIHQLLPTVQIVF